MRRHARRLAALTAVTALAVTACGDDAAGPAPPADPAEFAAGELEAAATTPTTDAPPPTTTQPDELRATDVPGEPVNQYELEVGDCFDRIEGLVDGRPYTVTTRLPCDTPHQREVYRILTYPAGYPAPFPGQDAMRDYALQRCYREFEAWVGRPYETSSLDIDVIVPNQENFEGEASRYRGIHCVVRRVDGETMVGSSRDRGW